MNKSEPSVSRPNTAATGMSSLHNSSTDSFTYSVISSKFESTGEVILLPKVNARRSIKFKKEMTGPRIIAVRETAQWLISKNNNVADDLSKEVQRLDDSYLKWYRKHFNDKRDVLDRVSNLLNSAKKEKNERCVSFSSFYKNNSTPASRRSRVHSMQSPRKGVHTPCFATELPDVEDVEKGGQGTIKLSLETAESCVEGDAFVCTDPLAQAEQTVKMDIPEQAEEVPAVPQLYGEPTNKGPRSPTKPVTKDVENEKKEKKVIIVTPNHEGGDPMENVLPTPPKSVKSSKGEGVGLVK